MTVLAALSVINAFALSWATMLMLGFVTPFIGSRRTTFTPIGPIEWSSVGLTLLSLPIYTASLATTLLVATVGLLLRRSTFRMLMATLGSSLLLGLTSAAFRFDSTFRHAAEIVGIPPHGSHILLTLNVGVVALSVLACTLLCRSRTLHLWLPYYNDDFEVGRWLIAILGWFQRKTLMSHGNGRGCPLLWIDFRSQWEPFRLRLLGSPAQYSRQSVEVRGALADAAVMELIRAACRDASLTDGPLPADWVLVLVGSHTDWDETSAAIQELGPRAVCVLLDSTSLDDNAEEFRRYQWMDFRSQSPEELFRLLSALRAPESAERDGACHPPIMSARFRAPLKVHAFISGCRTFLAYIGGIAIGAIVARPFDGRSLALTAISALLIACTAYLHTRTTKRWITSVQFRNVAVATGLVSLAWSATLLSIYWHALVGAFSIFADDAALLVGPSLLFPLFLAVAHWSLVDHWVPLTGAQAENRWNAVGAGIWAAHTTPLCAAVGFALAIGSLSVM